MDMITQDEKQKILTSSTTMVLKDMKTEVVIILNMVIPNMLNLDVNTLVMSAQSMNNLDMNIPGASIPSMNFTERIPNMNTTSKILNMNTTVKILNTNVKINAKLKFKTASLVVAIKTINSRVDDDPTMQFIRVGLVSSYPSQLLYRIVADLCATKIICLEGRKELLFRHS